MTADRAIKWRYLVVLAALFLLGSCSDDQPQAEAPSAPVGTAETEAESPSTPAAFPAATLDPAVALPRPTPAPPPAASEEERVAAGLVSRAPLGTYLVAKQGVGIPLGLPQWSDGRVPLEIPVYDEPFGDARTLTTRTSADAGPEALPLLDWGNDGPPLVLRVLAGTVADDWIQVEAPMGPMNDAIWVRAEFFEFHFTPRRIEIDIAGAGQLRLIDGGDIIIESPLTQPLSGDKPARHVTYVEGGGMDGVRLASPLRLDGGRGLFHVAPDVSGELLARIGPGTPVIIFDSLDPGATAAAVVRRAASPAETVEFADPSFNVSRTAERSASQMWIRCGDGTGRVCGNGLPSPSRLVPIGTVFATARPESGEFIPQVGNVVPVYDEPGGEKRMLVDASSVTGAEQRYALYNPTVFGQPLVLRIVGGAPGDEWLYVQAPVRPHRRAVWVRADDFVLGSTTNRIEVDIGEDQLLRLFDRDTELISSLVVSGRQARRTTLHDTYVEQAFAGTDLSPAYGTWILTLASYSQDLDSFGGGGLPGQSLHGTTNPELIGQRVSSGGIRVPNEVVEFIYAQPGILGARVVIYNSDGITRLDAIERQWKQPWSAALTTTFLNSALPLAGLPSYS